MPPFQARYPCTRNTLQEQPDRRLASRFRYCGLSQVDGTQDASSAGTRFKHVLEDAVQDSRKRLLDHGWAFSKMIFKEYAYLPDCRVGNRMCRPSARESNVK